ncbi:unnamed protein product [Rotaria sp. Silwood2]|nr:unnamed protein product [Rotaria sp. Silwood2]CAF4016085.1 unnamed protein product [Rotaria sp. Silwood2]
MLSDTLEKYKNLLAKVSEVDDKYVIIDVKWLEHWKRFVGIEKSEEDKVTDPGPIDFTKLVDPATANSSNEVQLRSDAVEKNDFTFIPYELYKELVETHDKNGPEIIRTAIPQGSCDTVIETFLVPLRLRESKSFNARIKQIYRSRRTKIEELKKDICHEFHMAPISNYRLYSSVDEKGLDWKPIDEQSNLTLEDIDLTKNAFIICESRALSARNDTSSSSSKINYTLGSSSYSTSKTYFTRGLCGLSNLGNTCFMNSALQCLSNVPALTEYFLRDEYKEHINRNNPLGMKGDVALAYGELIHEMWSGKTNFCAPASLKKSVARYAPQFSGYAQQDSQEFMSFLLDGLHEDLNLVKDKPYIEKKDDDGKFDDEKLAAEQWSYYLKRNQSKIHDIFHGQIKSIVHCLTCGTAARTFDPICFLSLPLPGKCKIRTFKIDYVRLSGQIKSYDIKCDEHGRVRNLVQEFCDRFQQKKKKITDTVPMETDAASKLNGTNQDEEEEEEEEEEEDFTKASDYDGHQPKPDHILSAEIYNHRIHLQYSDNTLLTTILERDQVVFYEVPDSLKAVDSEKILMPCIFRDDNYRQNFGLPMYLSIPRRNCKGRDIQEALQERIGNFLPLPQTDSSDKQFYTAILTSSQGYGQSNKLLKSCLDEHIDFSRRNASLIVEVASSIVEKYKKQEEEKRSEKDRTSSMTTGTQTRSQQKRATTLLDCFKYFTKKEVLSDNDLWKCPKCNELKKATKKMDLWLLPKVLIVQLKRFNYNRYFRDKIDLLIECPLHSLDLSQFVVNPAEKVKAKYDLIAVSNHMGGLGGGHYTAHAKNSDDKKWHTFDDSYVSDVNENNVINIHLSLLFNSNDQIARTLDNRLRNSSFPNIGTTCLNDAPLASDKEPYKCGEGDKNFYVPVDSTDSNKYARCSECFTKALQICPSDSFGRPPTRKTKSGIVLYDLDDFSVNEYLLKSHHAFTDNRYGGLTFGEQIEDDYFNRSHALVWFNNKGYHALPSYLNVMNNLILRSKISDPTIAAKFGISTYSHPFTLNSDLLSQQSLEQRISDFGVAITVLCAYSFVPAAVILYLVREYVTQEKRLIFICGVKPLIYWLSTFVWDLVYYLILISLTMALIKIFNISAFNSRIMTTQAIFCLLFLYGWSSIPLVYCLVRVFKDTSTAFMAAFCIWMFSGMLTCIADLMLTLYAWVPGIVRVQSILSRFFLVIPPYCLGSGLVHLMRNELMADFGRTIDANLYVNPFSLKLVGDRIIAMIIMGFIGLIVTYVLDLDIRFPSFFYKIPAQETTMDGDVMEERHRILHSNETNHDILQAKSLTKVFRRATGQSLLAVDHLCFGISKGQCFGLLGINGAGKTTTFKMITGDVRPTSGDCFLYEKQIRSQAREYPGSIGYCPQFDAVDGYLTSREALMCYAKLIGITDREHVVNLTLKKFHMESFANRIIRTYSGGMRRKLSVAVAMLGQPDLILLDEPTNGMDPGNRRIVWNNIIKAKKQDKAILLTSHSMAECDVLCSRLAIMVNGQFKCLGTPQHLKHRFGTGYYLKLRLEDESSIQIASNIIHQYLPDSNMTERHGTRLEYNIPKTHTLSKIFGFIETNKTLMNVIDYSLSQTTLEHVFLRFASKQRDNSIANLEDVIIDDTASISSSTVHSFVQTTDKANNTFSRRSPSFTPNQNDNSSQTAADIRELPVIDSCTDLVLNVDRPPSSTSNTSSQQDEHVFRI